MPDKLDELTVEQARAALNQILGEVNTARVDAVVDGLTAGLPQLTTADYVAAAGIFLGRVLEGAPAGLVPVLELATVRLGRETATVLRQQKAAEAARSVH